MKLSSAEAMLVGPLLLRGAPSGDGFGRRTRAGGVRTVLRRPWARAGTFLEYRR
jgi:hypothetical protein